MMNLAELKISYHFQNDRQGRKARIDSIINGNFGQVVREIWYKDAWRCLTDTGLIVIVNAEKWLILTYYFALPRNLTEMYMGTKVPEAILNKCKKNAATYNKLYHESIMSELRKK